MVKLLYTSPLWLISNGIRQSHNTTNKADSYWLDGMSTECPYCGSNELEESVSQYACNVTSICTACGANLQIHTGEKDYNLIKRVGFKFKHESILEHSLIVYEFEASRALLQELSRHRIGVGPTIKSTRYTLKELKDEKNFITYGEVEGENVATHYDLKRASKYVVLTDDDTTNAYIIDALERVKWLMQENKSNDIAKYALPEAYKFKGQVSFNLRSLLHLLKLRIDKSALKEFRLLCKNIINSLPLEWKELVLLDEQIKRNYKELNNE